MELEDLLQAIEAAEESACISEIPAVISKVDYVPIDMHSEDIESKLKERNGPSELKYYIHFLYYKKQYEPCIKVCKEYCDFMDGTTALRDVIECWIRSLLKTGKAKESVPLIDKLSAESKEVGHFLFAAMVYKEAEMFHVALIWLRKYLNVRKGDPKALLELGDTLLKLDAELYGILLLNRALEILTKSDAQNPRHSKLIQQIESIKSKFSQQTKSFQACNAETMEWLDLLVADKTTELQEETLANTL